MSFMRASDCVIDRAQPMTSTLNKTLRREGRRGVKQGSKAASRKMQLETTVL